MAATKLPVWRTAKESNLLLWQHRDQLFAMSWAWILVMIPVYALTHWLGTRIPNFAYLDWLIELPFLSSIAVAWHRLLLDGERVGASPYLRLDRTVLRYIGLSLVIVLPWVPALAAASIFDEYLPDGAGYVMLLLIVIFLLVSPRLMLVLPATALRAPMTLAQSWRLTRRNTWRLALGSIIAVYPALLVHSWVTQNADYERNLIDYLARWTLGSIVFAVGVTSGVAFLSLAYRHFTASGGSTDATASPSAPPPPPPSA